MTDKTNLQKQLELFKSQIKEVNESLYKFESQFKQEKDKKMEHLVMKFSPTRNSNPDLSRDSQGHV